MNWWALITSLLLAGTVAAHVFPEGKTFEYDYRMVVLNGIPELNQQYAVHGLKCVVHIHSVNARKLLMEIKNVQVAKENKIFSELSPEEIPLQLSSNNAYHNLTKPFIVEYERDGTVKELNFYPSDPSWSRHLKTGLATMVQIMKLDSVVESNQFNRGEQDDDIGTVYQQMEPTPSGVCNSIYSFQLMSKRSQPREMIIDKTRDYHDCEHKPYFASSTHRRFKCDDCEDDDSHPLHKNDVCKYNVTLTGSKDYIIQQALCDGILQIKPFGQEADALTVIHNRTLELRRVKSIEESARTSLSNFNWETEQPYSNLTESLVNIRNPESLNEPIMFQELCDDCDSLKDQTRHVFRQYLENIKKQHLTVEDSQQILDQIPLIQRGLISLDYNELKELTREFTKDKLSKETFFECVALTATNPCIKLIMESCTNKMITPENCAKHLSTIAAHVNNPNTLLADKMLEFCMSSEVQNHEQMAVTCYLSFGSIVAQTVAKGPYQIPKTTANIFSNEKRQHYVRALEKKLESTDDELQQAALLMALGNCALEEALPAIEKYIRASDDVPKVVQIRAIYSLVPLCRLFPELVREPLISVLFNNGENTEARIAAFNVLVVSRPRRHLFEKIAAMTQYGDDDVLNTYIYSSFSALANATQPCLADAASHAQHSLDLINDEYDTSAWTAQSTMIEGEMEHLDADAFLRLTSVGDAGSMTPSMLYLQLKNLISNYATNVYTMAMNGNNTSYLVETLIGAQAIFEDRSLADSLHALNKPLKSLGLKDLAQQVGYIPRKQPQFSAIISSRFMDFQQRLARVDKETLLRMLRASGAETKKEMHFTVDTQTTRMPVDVKLFMHLDCGHIFALYVQTPIHMSLKGEIRINPKPSVKSMNIDIDAKIKVNIASRATIKAGIMLPEHVRTAVGVGYETTAIAAPLIAGKINIELQKKKLSIKCKADSTYSGSESEVFHYHTRPFTVIYPIFELKGLSEFAKTIHNEKRPTKSQVQILGNALVLKMEDEQYWDDAASIYKYFEENSILGIAVNGWMTHQWTPRKYSLMWKTSQLPELTYDMEWEYKPAPGDPAQHVDSFVYVLWRQLFGLSDVPMRCQNTDDDRDDSKSTSSSEENKRYNSDQDSSSKSDESRSNEGPDFKHFEHTTDNQGRWWGWKSDHFAYDSKHQNSEESAQPRWAMGYMQPEKDEDNSRSEESQRWVAGRHDSSSRSSEHRRGSSKETSGKGRWAWKSDAPFGGKFNFVQADLTEGVAVYVVRAEAKVKGNSEKGIKVDIVIKKPRDLPDSSIDVLVKTTGSLQAKMVCLKAKYSGERPLCHLTTSRPSLKNANITLNASLSWGRACSEPEGFVNINLRARKSREQMNMQKFDKPYFYDQCKSDKEDNLPYSYACMEKLDYESRLNYLTAVVKYSKISRSVQNFTEKVQDFVIYNLYPHLSHDSFAKNPSDQLKFSANFHPTMPVVDLKIYRPQETLKFNTVYYGDVEPFVGPVSVDKSYARTLLDYYTDGDVTPTCFVTDNYVQTFDNSTFNFDGRDSCQYLISGDCSPSDLFYVLIKNNTKESRDNSKTLTIQFLQNLIEINPKARQVTINDKQVEMKDETITFLKDESYGPTLLGYIIKADSLYKIILPYNRISIVFDGVDVVVRTSNLWRHKLCGICGEYNPGSDDGFKGPRKCEYSIGNDFAESYALRTDQCPKAEVEGDKDCDSDDTSFRHIPSQGSCVTRRPLVKRMGSGKKICGSLETFKACKAGCEAKETQQITVPFKCVGIKDKVANDLMNNQEKWIQFAEHRTEDFSAEVEVPVTCAPRN